MGKYKFFSYISEGEEKHNFIFQRYLNHSLYPVDVDTMNSLDSIKEAEKYVSKYMKYFERHLEPIVNLLKKNA